MRTRTRLLLGLLLLAVPALLLLQLLAQRRIVRVVEDRTVARLEAEARLVADVLGDAGAVADEVADRYGRLLRVRVTVIAADGTVLGDSERDGEGLRTLENHAGRPEVTEALAGRRGHAVRRSDTVGTELHYLAMPVSAAGEARVVRLAVSSEELLALERLASRGMSVATFAVALAILAIGYGLARRASSPIESIEGMAQSLARGIAPGPARASGPVEVQEIARSLSSVGERLKEQVEALAQERNLLRTILSGMREGLLIVDGDERIVLAGSHARTAFPGIPGALEGRLAVEIVRDPEFLDLLRAALGRGGSGHKRVQLFDGRIIELRVVPLEGPGLKARGALALLLDVTQMERLESVRRDFVANVSHELRTPLSSIRAFVETLLDETGPEGSGRHFLEIIQRNAARMEELVNDLTDLSLIETGAISLSLEDVSLRAVVAEVFDMVAAKASAAGVRLVSEVPEDCRVRGDARRVTQVMLNLVDNAVKWNRKDGEARVRATGGPGSVAVDVEDDGPGIAPEHRENIFHRFYRVPGSGERNGTGLGLAIVKHLVRLHGGTIEVASEPGRGSRFRVVLPAPRA